MLTKLVLSALILVLIATGCADRFHRSPLAPDHRSAMIQTSVGQVPIDPTFELTAEQRRDVRALFDADALETFLAALPADRRADTFELFRRRRPGHPVPLLTDMGGGPLQELLDEVWAPRWLTAPELLATPSGASRGSYELPGRAAALRRLQKAKSDPR